MDIVSMFLTAALSGVFCFVVSCQIIVRRRIADQTHAYLLGSVVVPFTLGSVGFVGVYLSTVVGRTVIAELLLEIGIGVVGGWFGSSLGFFLTNQRKSVPLETPQSVRATSINVKQYSSQQVKSIASELPQRHTVEGRLRESGQKDTPNNIRLYLLGQLIAGAFFFVILLQVLMPLGFTTTLELKKLSGEMRLLGIVAPYSLPGLLYLIVKHRSPALALGLFHGFAPIALLWIPIYATLNLVAGIR